MERDCMRVDVMVDLETLGTNIDSTIIQISAIAFNIESKRQYGLFDERVDIKGVSDLKIDGETLLWWLNENPSLLKKLLSDEGFPPEELLIKFHNWIAYLYYIFEASGKKVEIYLWGNGILFDNKMIEYQMKKIGLDYPIFYRNDRDLRTIVDLTAKKLNVSTSELKDSIEFSGEEHNAIDDVEYQIKLLMFCYATLLK